MYNASVSAANDGGRISDMATSALDVASGSFAFLFLRTTADTEGVLSGDIESQFAVCEEAISRCDMLRQICSSLERRFGITLSNANSYNVQNVPRAKRLMAQTLLYLGCAILEEIKRERAGTACTSYSRGAFPALLWSEVAMVDEFNQWGEEYLHLQRSQIEKATLGRNLGHCEVLLARPYSIEDEIELSLSDVDVWIKDYRSPRVLLIAGDVRSLQLIIQRSEFPGGITISARSPVTPCNAAHLPLVDPTPQQVYLKSVPVHTPKRIYIAQATGLAAPDGPDSEDKLRDFILHTGVGPMRTFDALCALRSYSQNAVAVGTAKSFSAICIEPELQPCPVSHLPIGVERCRAK